MTVAAVADPSPEEYEAAIDRECSDDDDRAEAIDRELEAIKLCAEALRILQPNERPRVLAYLAAHFTPAEPL